MIIKRISTIKENLDTAGKHEQTLQIEKPLGLKSLIGKLVQRKMHKKTWPVWCDEMEGVHSERLKQVQAKWRANLLMQYWVVHHIDWFSSYVNDDDYKTNLPISLILELFFTLVMCIIVQDLKYLWSLTLFAHLISPLYSL